MHVPRALCDRGIIVAESIAVAVCFLPQRHNIVISQDAMLYPAE
jgi:hypothetical protein